MIIKDILAFIALSEDSGSYWLAIVGHCMTIEQKTVIRTVIDAQLKAEFEAAAKGNDRVLSQVLRDLIREYVWRFSNGEAWEPGQAIKLRQSAK